MNDRNPPAGTFVALVLGVPFVLGCAFMGLLAGALVDLLASGFDGPTVFTTLLDPGSQGALAGGAFGLVAVVMAARRFLRPLPRFSGVPPTARSTAESRAQARGSGRSLVVLVAVLAGCVAVAVSEPR